MSLEGRINQAEKRVPAKATRPGVVRPANILDLASNPFFLGIDLYPTQGTILKVAKGVTELLTDFDREVIRGWEENWVLQQDNGTLRYAGTEGTPPGLLDRLDLCAQQGRRGPSEIALVFGRRGSKGVMSAVLVADLLYGLLLTDAKPADSPPLKGKTLAVYVMGAKYEQAKRNAFGDIKSLIEGSPAFQPFLGRCTNDSVSLLTPSQIEAGATVGRTAGLLEVRAVETTPRAGRGPTMVGLVLDEFAHLAAGAAAGPESSSIDIYRAIKPALAQFPKTGLTLQTSSPWEKDGQLYASYQLACELDPDSHQPRVPGLLMLQLPSWATYAHWEKSTDIPMWPGGPTFPAHEGPIIERKGLLDLYQEIDPEAFNTEYGAQFAASVNAYLNQRTIRRLTEPPNGEPLQVKRSGVLAHAYAAHGDPARVGDSFGFAIGHVERDEHDLPHVYIDDAFAWNPSDFPDHTINYIEVEDDIKAILARFPIRTLTFDQYASAGTIDRLRAHVAGPGTTGRTDIFERTATAPQNWLAAETFKTAALLGLIHIPPELTRALAELEALQVTGQRVDHPTSGPVRGKDIADSIMNVVFTLIGENHEELFKRLGDFPVHGHPGMTRNSPARLAVDPDTAMFDRLSAITSGRARIGHGAARGQGYSAARGSRTTRGSH